jgi:hypothetical protein
MHRTRTTLGILLTIPLLLVTWSDRAQAACQPPNPPPTDPLVYLRTNCTGADARCFTHPNTLFTWMECERRPDADLPLLVDIGPGTFEVGTNVAGGQIQCNSVTFPGHTRFRGRGAECLEGCEVSAECPTGCAEGSLSPTKFVNGINATAALWVWGCEALEFHDMTFEGPKYGVVWYPDPNTRTSGSSLWVRTEIKALGDSNESALAWREEALVCPVDANPPFTPGKHTFYGSRVWARDIGAEGVAYVAQCDENVFYGGEIIAEGTAQSVSTSILVAVETSGQGSLETYGTRVMADSNGSSAVFDSDFTDGVTAVTVGRELVPLDDEARGGGAFEAYGGEIVASAQGTAGGNAVGIEVGPSGATGSVGIVETPGASFRVDPGASGGKGITTSHAETTELQMSIGPPEEE